MPNPLKLKALLIDLNGTLHIGRDPTPNAVRALERLRTARMPFILCSNSTKESSASLLRKLRDMGFKAEDRELMTSLGACRQLVEERGLCPYLLLSPSAKEEFADLPGPSNPDAYDSVVIGLDEPSLSYTSLNIAFRILRSEPITTPAAEKPNRDRKPTLIAPHVSMFQQSPATDSLPGGLSLGIGPFVRALEAASGVEAEVVGKPTRRFFELAIKRLEELYPDIEGLGAGDVGVIGDDVVNDLGTGARELGMTRILVRTGKYRPGVEETTSPPDVVYDSFAEFADDIL